MNKSLQIGLIWATSLSVHAMDGETLITQAKASAGNVSPGDTPGYPVTLNLPGKYKLAGNLTVPDGDTTAILITAPNVTLDLNGFSLLGPVQCVNNGIDLTCDSIGDGMGINVSVPGLNVFSGASILNGAIRGFGSHGIGAGQGTMVYRMRILNNGGDGIRGEEAMVTESLIANNRMHGISGNGFNIQGNRIVSNGDKGILANVTTGLSDNVISGNLGGELNSSPEQLGGNLCGAALCP